MTVDLIGGGPRGAIGPIPNHEFNPDRTAIRFQTSTGDWGEWLVIVGGSGGISEILTVDLSYSGVTSTITAGESVAFGNLLYRNPTDGRWYKAQANAVLTVPALRMALAAADAGGTVLSLCPGGVVRNDAWNFTDDGSVVEIWLSAAVAGSITESVDTTEGCFGQVIGTPLAANILEFRPVLPVARY